MIMRITMVFVICLALIGVPACKAPAETKAAAAASLEENFERGLLQIEADDGVQLEFDVYLAVGGTVSERRIALLWNSWYFFKDVFRILFHMLKVDGRHRNIKEWISGLNFLFGKPGILRRPVVRYFSFFRKRFHPWNHDNRYIIDEWSTQQLQSSGQC